MTTQELLIAAKEKIADPAHWDGFRKGQAQHCYCSATAIWEAEGSNQLGSSIASIEAGLALAEAIGLDAEYHNHYSSVTRDVYWTEIYNWNDAPERTHAEVMAAFDSAIAATA